MSARLSEAERGIFLNPCACGHKFDSHGSLVECWECGDEGRDCKHTYEDLLVERIEQVLAARLARVEEVAARVLGEHATVTTQAEPRNNADLNLGRTRYERRCTCGAQMPWGNSEDAHRAHVAERIVAELGGAE